MKSRYQRLAEAHAQSRVPLRSRLARGAAALRVWALRLAGVGLVAGCAAGAGGAVFYEEEIRKEPGAHVTREAILAIIAQESAILASDGQTRLGVFFDREHRVYVPYDRIPAAWKAAIVAAEDQRYWEHPGVDPLGIGRAMWKNLEAGALVAGGSSLTQQTAKNLYYRPDRSLRSKWDELVNALRLEAHFSKEEILEFYANQFHVSANGRGIGIAARYFFDKDASELNTLECAFIAGLVKAPAAYNPFVGRTEERRAEARARGWARTQYVLGRMRATGALSAQEHARLLAQESAFLDGSVFRQGTFRYDRTAILDEVAARLEQAPFPALFAEVGIDNPSTAGLTIVTTIDAGAQRAAEYGLQHHLTEVGVRLEKLGADALILTDAAGPDATRSTPPAVLEVLEARVVAHGKKGIELDLGAGTCTVDAAAQKRVGAHLAGGARTRLDEVLPVGAVVRASLRAPGRCDLEVRPRLQGAVLALDQGQIRVMVGGSDNRNFNRAIAARRQFGSTWKPIVYAAAMALGWTPVDLLDNRPNVFRFEGSHYAPRGDHEGAPFTTLSWAGARSENLASVWLLAHLVDRLDRAALRALAAELGMVPEGLERDAWIRRVRDEWGVISTPARFDEIAFFSAREELLAEGVSDPRDEVELISLGWGGGTEAEERRLRERGDRERLAALQANYLAMAEIAGACAAEAETLKKLAGAAEEPGFFGGLFGRAEPEVDLAAARAGLRRTAIDATGAVSCGALGDGPAPETLAAIAAGTGPALGAPRLFGRLPLPLFAELQRRVERRRLVLEGADPWDLEVLLGHPDFRTWMAIRAVSRTAAAFGITSELPPVLSLPLGASEVTLEEMAVAYDTMAAGHGWLAPGGWKAAGDLLERSVASPERGTSLIAEIRDREGVVLYRARPVAGAEVPAAPGALLTDVLRNVVRAGTGRRAVDAVRVGSAVVPVSGKTGTTNGFKNAAFIGNVPRVVEGAWSAERGITVAVYVGYDDNTPMTGGGLRLAGASGALPVWLATAQGLADAGLLGDPAGVAAEVPDPPGTARVSVETEGGVPSADGAGTVLFRGEVDDGVPAPVRAVQRLGGAPPPAGGGPDAPGGGAAPIPPVVPVPIAEEDVWVDEMADPSIAVTPDDAAPVEAPAGEVPADAPPEDLPEDIDPRIAPVDGAEPG